MQNYKIAKYAKFQNCKIAKNTKYAKLQNCKNAKYAKLQNMQNCKISENARLILKGRQQTNPNTTFKKGDNSAAGGGGLPFNIADVMGAQFGNFGFPLPTPGAAAAPAAGDDEASETPTVVEDAPAELADESEAAVEPSGRAGAAPVLSAARGRLRRGPGTLVPSCNECNTN